LLFLGSEAVLGPQTHGNPPSIEQRVGRQKLRPGSGFLSVRVTTDGPTRVLQVLDIKERVCQLYSLLALKFILFLFVVILLDYSEHYYY